MSYKEKPKGRTLALDGVSMNFGTFTALRDVDLQFEPGLVHAVVGQNGAGKTTFSRIVCGIYAPSSGHVLIDGKPLRAGSVESARAQGVDMVHQHFSSPPSMTIAETLQFFGSPDSFYSSRKMVQSWQKRVSDLGFDLDVKRKIRELSVPERQSVEIVRALSGGARIVIFDEPTASMPAQAVDRLLERIRTLAAAGLTVITVLHKLNEVFSVADTVTVLNRGKVTLQKAPIKTLSQAEVTRYIIEGSPVEDSLSTLTEAEPSVILEEKSRGQRDSVRNNDASKTEAILQVEKLSTSTNSSDHPLEDVSFSINAGEIVGIAGIEGNGQVSLVEALIGLYPANGSIFLDGVAIQTLSVIDRRRSGLRVIPFERNVEGVSAGSAIWENFALGAAMRSKQIMLPVRRFRALAQDQLAKWGVSYRNLDQSAGELSGGNVQRTILAREMDSDARLVIAAQPTRGLDVGAIDFVQRSLRRLSEAGNAVLLISTDLEELKDMSDRILVLRGGRNVADLQPDVDLRQIGSAMLGEADASF